MNGASITPWLTGIGALLTGLAALTALALVGWSEARKLRSQHEHEERSKLQALIGRHHGPLLEAALDWDRRMHQLYDSRPADPNHYGKDAEGLTELEWFLADPTYFGTDDWLYGKFCDPDEYMFRSYVFRFLALCSQARQFEAQAFYIDSQVARKQDFQFLKYAKAFLWASTHGELHDDEVPAVDHFPNDEFRPILDTCNPVRNGAMDETNGSIFDLARLDSIVAEERKLYAQRIKTAREQFEAATRGSNGASEGESENDLVGIAEEEIAPVDKPTFNPPAPRGIGHIILFFIGLRRPTWRDGGQNRLTRYNWDRLCVLHLLVMAFINEFGYPWQRRKEADIRKAADAIVDRRVAIQFARSIPSLGLAQESGTSTRLGVDYLQSVLPATDSVA